MRRRRLLQEMQMGRINTRLIDFIVLQHATFFGSCFSHVKTVKVPILQLGQNAKQALTAAPGFVQDKISRIAVEHVGISELTDS